MSEREEYYNDGWMFLNKRPTVTLLGNMKNKKQQQPSDPISTEMCYSLCAADQFVVQESLFFFSFC